MSKLNLIIGIDVSGQPYDDIYVGLASIKQDQIKSCEKKFKSCFISYKRKKGAKLSNNDLKNIIQFLNNENIFMYSIHFSSKEWNYFKEKYPNKSFFKERVYSLLYSELISKAIFKHNLTLVSVCMESNININKVITYTNELLKSNNFNVILSTSFSNVNLSIMFADFIAAAHRKVDPYFLEITPRFKRYSSKAIDYKEIKKIFNK